MRTHTCEAKKWADYTLWARGITMNMNNLLLQCLLTVIPTYVWSIHVVGGLVFLCCCVCAACGACLHWGKSFCKGSQNLSCLMQRKCFRYIHTHAYIYITYSCTMHSLYTNLKVFFIITFPLTACNVTWSSSHVWFWCVVDDCVLLMEISIQW